MSEEALGVLLVDDEASLREPLAKYLRDTYGYQVDTVADGEEAWDHVLRAKRPYDVALIDDLLTPRPGVEPEPVGIELMRRIKERCPETECIIFTGWGMDRALEALQAGAYRYLAKPLNLDELGMTIRMAAERRQLKQQLETTKQEKEWLQIFLEIGMVTTAVLELDEVLERVHEQVGRLMDASGLDVVLYDESSQTLRFELGYDRGEREAQWERPFTEGKGLTDWVIEHSDSLLIRDYPREGPPVPAHQRGEISRSWLGVPLVARNRVIGAITVQSYEPDQFGEAHQQILTTVASHVASAIENAWLFSELAETKDRLEALIASSFDAVIAIDQDKKITVFNRRAEEMLGWTASEMIGHTVTRLHADMEKAEEILDTVNRDGTISGWNVELKHRDGATIPALLSAALVRDSMGHPIGQAGFMRDLRQVNLLEERLRALMEATWAVTSTLELEEVLNLIVESAVAAFPTAHHGSIHLYDEGANLLRLRVNSFGYSPDAIDALSFKPGEGLAGWVYEHNQPLVVANAQEDTRYKRIDHPEVLPHKSIICVPLQAKDKVIGVLSLDNLTTFGVFKAGDLGLLSTFADQAAIAIDNAQSFKELQAYARHMDALVKVSKNLTKTFKLDDQIGLVRQFVREQFEVSSFFVALYDRVADWVYFPLAYDKDQPIHISEYSLDDLSQWGTTGYVVKKGQEIYWATEEERQEVQELLGVQPKSIGEPCVSCLFLPLKAGDDILGAISIQSCTPHALSPVVKNVFRALASQVTTSVKSVQLYQEAQAGLHTLQSLYEGGSAIISMMDPERILDVIVQKAHHALGGWRAEVIRITEMEEPVELATVGFDRRPDIATWIRPDGVSVQVVRSGEPRIIENAKTESDTVNPWMLQDGVGSATCMPLNLRGKNIGVMWIHYREPRAFSQAEIEALRIYANQAAIAYDNARRMQELDHLRKAAEKLASVASVQEVLQQIVKSAKEVLEAHSSAIWSYDQIRDKFIPEELVAEGIPEDELGRFREEEPRPGRTAYTVMQRGWVSVEDILQPSYEFLGEPTRKLLRRIGVRRFQGVALKVGDERLGVLYVNYRQPRSFGDEDKITLETFAYDAALVLKKARLLQQVEQTKQAAQVVAGVTVQEDLPETLDTIVRHVREVLQCDAVSLYSYDETKDRLGPWAIDITDACAPDSASPPERLSAESAVWTILRLEGPTYHCLAEDGAIDHPLFRGKFVRKEHVRAAFGIQLRVGERKVGVMFVNYRSSHRFSSEEIATIELFANQAAVAVRSFQLYEEVTRRVNALEALFEAGKAVTSTLALDDILYHIAEQAWRLTGRYGKRARFSHIALVEGSRLKFEAAYPPEHLPGLRRGVGDIDLEHDECIGITGRAVKTRQSQLIGDVAQNPDYIEYDPETRSELTVPVELGEKVIGVINVEHPNYYAFDKEDQRDLESLAVQAAIAIENARLYQQATERLNESQALQQVATSLAGTFEFKEVLSVVMMAAMSLTDTGSGSILFWDSQTKTFTRTLTTSGPNRTLEPYHSRVRREGGIAWAIIDQCKPVVIPDTREDPRVSPIAIEKGRRALIGVPLVSCEEPFGVLYVNDSKPHQFSNRQVTLLETLASQAAVAIERAHQYEDLKRTKGLVGARTALAWIGMTSSTWRHGIEKHAQTIQDQIKLLRKDLRQAPSHDHHTQMDERLSMVERLASQISEKPITPPLSAEEGASSVSVNELIQERTKQLWQSQPYQSIGLQLDLALDDRATVRASPEWLRRALDVLVDNTVDATADSALQRITIATRQRDDQAEILVSDTGTGISEEILPKLFWEPIKKPKGVKGLGMGLLMAQVIVQTYGGEIGVDSTSPTGTTMFIRLPLEA